MEEWNDMLLQWQDDPQAAANHMVLGMDINQRRQATGNPKSSVPTWF
jgi:hypothetical protein